MVKAKKRKWDAFISHAVEDQATFVRNLAHTLTGMGLKIWYSEASLQIGNSLSASIDRGLAESRYGIVVISQHFMSKKWTKRELAGLTSRQTSEENDVILPIWYGVTKEEVRAFSPPLLDLLAHDTATMEAAEIARQLLRRIKPRLYRKLMSDSGEPSEESAALADLQIEIETTREALDQAKASLEEYQCPICNAPLSQRLSAPTSDSGDDWDTREHFECGHTTFAGFTERPCPRDQKFPRLEDYELKFRRVEGAMDFSWQCFAVGKTRTADRVSLGSAYAATKEEAAKQIQENYKRVAKDRF